MATKRNPLNATVVQHKEPHVTLTQDAAVLLDELAVVQIRRGQALRCHRAATELRAAAKYTAGLEKKLAAKGR